MIFRTLAILSICVPTAWSAENALSVRTLALTDDPIPELFVKQTEEYVALDWSHRQPGVIVKSLFANPLPLYRRVESEEGEMGYAVATKVKFPTKARGLLLLGWQSDGTTRCIGIKDQFREAGFDDWLLINAATRPVAFKVGDGDKMTVVPSGKSLDYRVRVPRGKGAEVVAKLPVKDGGAKTFYSTFWPIYPNKRSVIIFVDDGRKIRVKRISDKLLPKEAP